MVDIDIGETIKSNIDYWKNLYFKEKEKNKELEEIIGLWQNSSNKIVEITQTIINQNYISKDKIKSKIEELKDGTYDAKIILQKLLEE